MNLKNVIIITVLLIIPIFILPNASSAIPLRSSCYLKNNIFEQNEGGEPGAVILNLKRGDIVWRYVDKEIYPLVSFLMHPMMYTGRAIDMGSDIYYEFVEANGCKGVCYSLTSTNGIFNNSALFDFVYRVKGASPSDVENATCFAEEQVGSDFVPIYEKPFKNYNSTEDSTWYCTELVWAAYFNCYFHPSQKIYGRGIDIDANKGLVITPQDIHTSSNIVKEPLFLTVGLEPTSDYNSPIKQIIKKYPIFAPIFRKITETEVNTPDIFVEPIEPSEPEQPVNNEPQETEEITPEQANIEANGPYHAYADNNYKVTFHCTDVVGGTWRWDYDNDGSWDTYWKTIPTNHEKTHNYASYIENSNANNIITTLGTAEINQPIIVTAKVQIKNGILNTYTDTTTIYILLPATDDPEPEETAYIELDTSYSATAENDYWATFYCPEVVGDEWRWDFNNDGTWDTGNSWNKWVDIDDNKIMRHQYTEYLEDNSDSTSGNIITTTGTQNGNSVQIKYVKVQVRTSTGSTTEDTTKVYIYT